MAEIADEEEMGRSDGDTHRRIARTRQEFEEIIKRGAIVEKNCTLRCGGCQSKRFSKSLTNFNEVTDMAEVVGRPAENNVSSSSGNYAPTHEK